MPNARRTFWIADAETGKRREITARLRAQTSHAAMWVQDGTWHDVQRLEEAAEAFEEEIYPRVRAALGSEWTPGIDGDPRVSVLHATGLGAGIAGYVSTLDEYPRSVYPQSNEAELVTVNLEVVDVGSAGYDALLARGLARLVLWHQDRNEERWLREGATELAAALVGSQASDLHEAYLADQDTQVTGSTGSGSQWAAAHLFMTYVHQRFGDEGTRVLMAEPANGILGFGAALEELNTGLTFQDLFADWLAANYLDAIVKADQDRYRYATLEVAQPTPDAVVSTYPVTITSSVHQFGADYVVLRGEEDVRVQFSGARQTPLLRRMPRIVQPVWWSNRTDESLMLLTGQFDLGEGEAATLTYRVWHDIEPHYDYATVEISVDGGERWEILRTPSGTGDDPYGNSPGWGYTGKSAGWIREEVDVSHHAGGDVLLRFSYLTDGATTGEGLLLDDISIRQTGLEGAQTVTPSSWRAEGFLMTDGLVPQAYLAVLISLGDEVTVERLHLEEDQTAAWSVPLGREDVQEAVLVLSATSPLTRQPARYRLAITQ